MSTENTAFPQSVDIVSIVGDVAEAYFGHEMSRVPAGAIRDNEAWTSYVEIAGKWRGAVILSCRREFAVQASSEMLGKKPDDVTDEDALSVIAELTNVIGGNIKALISESVGGTCALSIPLVARGMHAFGDADDQAKLWFSSRGHLVCVRVIELDDPARTTARPIPHPTLQ